MEARTYATMVILRNTPDCFQDPLAKLFKAFISRYVGTKSTCSREGVLKYCQRSGERYHCLYTPWNGISPLLYLKWQELFV